MRDRVFATIAPLQLGLGLIAGCGAPGADGQRAQALSAVRDGDTVRLSVSLNEARPAHALEADIAVSGLTFPTDVAGLPRSGVAVLDRMEGSVELFDGNGTASGEFGRRGLGPGEYTEPYAVARSGDVLAVWDKRGRLTTMRLDGAVIGTGNGVVGDLPAAWQRVPLTQWDEPLQLSREDVTRRISALGGGDFGLLVQEHDERFDTAYTSAGLPRRFRHFVVRVDSLAQVRDTLLELVGQELRLATPASERTYSLSWERPFPLRPVWTSGAGWHGWGHGSASRFHVAFESGDTLVVEWPHDALPLGDPEYNSYLDWEIESYRRTRGDWDEVLTREDRRGWIDEELAVSDERPQLVGALGAGRCLALAGFRPDLGPHGESPVWVLIDLDAPTHVVGVSIDITPGFTRGLTSDGFYFVEIGERGERTLHRLPLPSGGPCGPTRTS